MVVLTLEIRFRYKYQIQYMATNQCGAIRSQSVMFNDNDKDCNGDRYPYTDSSI
jgi:hypothetical protein